MKSRNKNKEYSDLDIDIDGFEEDDVLFSNQSKTDFYAERFGQVRVSDLPKLLTWGGGNPKISDSQKARDCLYRLAWERCADLEALDEIADRIKTGGAAIRHGEAYEGEALDSYERVFDVKIDRQVAVSSEKTALKGTLDGRISDGAIFEVKCPTPAKYFKAIDTGQPYDTDHLIQVHGYLSLTEVAEAKLLYFDPHLKGDGFISFTVKYNKDISLAIFESAAKIEISVAAIAAKYENMTKKI